MTEGDEGETDEGDYPTLLEAAIGPEVVNMGIGGQTSTQIGVRQGGVPAYATVEGGTIPAQGGVTVKFATGYEPLTSPNRTIHGSIIAVEGVLTLSDFLPGGKFTFTPDPGSNTPVSVSGSPRFIPDAPYQNWFPIFWEGRNNLFQTAAGPWGSSQIESDIAQQVASLPSDLNYLVLPVLNENLAAERKGGAHYETLIGLNDELSATYGAHYLDVRSPLVASYDPSSAVDQTDHDNDMIPTSFGAISAEGTLADSIGPTETSFTVNISNGKLTAYHNLVIDNESIRVFEISGSKVVSCVRGYGGTQASHSAGAAVTQRDPTHLNKQGYAIVADAVVKKLASMAAAAPTFSPIGGTYLSAQLVTISDSTPGVSIYYTTDGTSPTTSSSKYTGPIAVDSSETLEAVAIANGYLPSKPAVAAYTIMSPAAAPTFSPGAGIYSSARAVIISDSTPDALIYYTTDGTPPTSASIPYSGPITVSASVTIKAIAFASGFTPSAVSTAQFTINLAPGPNPNAQAELFIAQAALDNSDLFLTIVSDSTCYSYQYTTYPNVAVHRWRLIFASMLSHMMPAYTVKYRQWNYGNGGGPSGDSYDPWATIQTGTAAHTLWISNASFPGATAYDFLGGRFQAAIGATTPDLVIVSMGHNLEPTCPDCWPNMLLDLTQSISLAFPKAGMILIGENPTLPPFEFTSTTAPKLAVIQDIASNRGYEFIDIYQAFLNSGYALDHLLMPDGVHPTSPESQDGSENGSHFWASSMVQYFVNCACSPDEAQQPSTLGTVGQQLLTNGTFEDFPDGAATPTGWSAEGAVTVSKDTALFTNENGYSLHLASNNAPAWVSRPLDINAVAGRCATLAAHEYVGAGMPNTAGQLRLSDDMSLPDLNDVNQLQSGDWRWLSVTHCFPAGITSAYVSIYADSGRTGGAVSIDKACLTAGHYPQTCPMGLTVTAHNATRVFGAPNPAFGGTIAGLKSGDNITATYSSVAGSTSRPGTYAIVPTLVDPDGKLAGYTVTTYDGVLTILPATPSVDLPSTLSTVVTQDLLVRIKVNAVAANPVPTGSVTMRIGTYTSQPVVLIDGSASVTIPAGSLVVGTQMVETTYTPDAASSSLYDSAYASGSATVTAATPTVTVFPSSVSITTAQPLNVTVTVNAGSSNPTPTGTVTLTRGGYSSAATNLSAGSATISISAGTLSIGGDSLVAGYSGDGNFDAATGAASISVNPTPNFALSASPANLSFAQGSSGTTTITVTTVGGFADNVKFSTSGLPGGVTASFAAGNTAETQVLTLAADNSASVTSAPVTVTVTGTSGALSATASLELMITAEPSFTAGSGGSTSLTLVPGATTGNTGTISVVGTNGFSGTVDLTCRVTTSMSTVNDIPICRLNSTSVSISGTAAQTSTLIVSTTPPTSARNQLRNILLPSSGGAALALLVFFAVPKRRNLLGMLGVFILVVSIGTLGCGGGGENQGRGGSGGGNPGTTPGAYTITVTGTSGNLHATVGTIALTVQ